MIPFSKSINSSQNALVKYVCKLKEKSAFRKSEKILVIEGVREISLALKGGYECTTFLYCKNLMNDKLTGFHNQNSKAEWIEVSLPVYQKMAHRGTTEGLLALAKARVNRLEDLKFETPHPLILVVESPEKPGNLGAVLRTADAAQVDAVIVADPLTDWYNPNVIRSSVGTVFANQLAAATTKDIIDYLIKRKIKIYTAALSASAPYHKQDFTQACAIVVGTEATGLTRPWLEASHQNIIIPMQGKIDSLNMAVSASVLIFEARRQRGFTDIQF